jgi:glutamate synthase domain-containing protein 3
MTGGQAFVHDPEEKIERHLNAQLVAALRISTAEADELRGLLERHARFTGSERAAALLGDWDAALARFWRVAPKAEVARIESAAEGTVAGKAAG